MTARHQFTDILLGPRVLRTGDNAPARRRRHASTHVNGENNDQARHRDDPIAHINIKKDTSFAGALLEAQRRGW